MHRCLDSIIILPRPARPILMGLVTFYMFRGFCTYSQPFRSNYTQSNCSVEMKAAVVIPLEVILLLLLPGMDGALYRMDEMVGKKSGTEDNAGNGRNHPLAKLKTPGVCVGTSPEMDIRAETTDKGLSQSKLRNRLSFKTCYKKIRIMFTPECSALQSTDFSNLRISDFCIGETVTFSGSIYFYVGMSRPSTVSVKISRSKPSDSRHKSKSLSLKYHMEEEHPEQVLDACDALSRIMCPIHHRLQCDCPISRETILLDSDVFIGHDFVLNEFGTGQMYAHITLNTPEDEVCLNIAFERVKRLEIE